MKYLKVWTSFRDVIQPLSDAEKGQLFDMMLLYADSGEEPGRLDGNVRFLWPAAKQVIDLAAEKVETLRENGRKGGIAKSKNKQNLANDSKSYQSVANVSLKEMKCNEKKGNEKESSFMDADDAQAIQSDHNRVLDAAEDAGFKMSNDVRAALIALYADNGLDKMLDALKSCVDHGATNLAYLKAVLKGESKKKVVAAQKFTQRDYDEVQDEAYKRMIKEIVS